MSQRGVHVIILTISSIIRSSRGFTVSSVYIIRIQNKQRRTPKNNIEQLESQRDELRVKLASVGDFRPGSLSSHYRKCGKPNCHCAQPGNSGHDGWQLTSIIDSTPRCRSIPKHALETTRCQIAEHARFLDLIKQYTKLNEQLCDLRLKAERSEK